VKFQTLTHNTVKFTFPPGEKREIHEFTISLPRKVNWQSLLIFVEQGFLCGRSKNKNRGNVKFRENDLINRLCGLLGVKFREIRVSMCFQTQDVSHKFSAFTQLDFCQNHLEAPRVGCGQGKQMQTRPFYKYGQCSCVAE
jgi:hypothetical protein